MPECRSLGRAPCGRRWPAAACLISDGKAFGKSTYEDDRAPRSLRIHIVATETGMNLWEFRCRCRVFHYTAITDGFKHTTSLVLALLPSTVR